MLQELTRRVRGWLRGEEAPRAAAPGAPERGVPDAARRLYETGAALLREGKPAEALPSLDAAVAAHPDYAEAHDQAGLALRELKRHEESLQRFQLAIDARHDFVDAISHQGIALLELERYEDAEDCFKLALAHDQGSADLWTHLAMACWNQRRMSEAIAHFRRALELDPGLAHVHLFLAGLLHGEGDLEGAAASYQRGLSLNPDVPELRVNYGLTLLKLQRADEAAVHLETAIQLRPDLAEAWLNLGKARRAQDRDREAGECFERVISLRPDHIGAHINLGAILRDSGAADRALEYYRRAHSIAPDSAESNHNMGVGYHHLDQPHEALAWYERAQKADPEHSASRLNLAIACLETGDLGRGWELFECRFHQSDPQLGAQPRPFSPPRWEGQPLAGKRILVWGEQGIGDEVLFSAMYQELAAAAQSCVIECAPKLLPLFARSVPAGRVVPRANPPHPEAVQPFDYQSPAGSLARRLRPGIGSFPARRGYLVADAARTAAWRDRLGRLGGDLRVGFSWRSSNLKGDRALSCTTLDQWGPIFAVPGVRFVCLQYGECGAELEEARRRFGVALHAFAEVDLFNDLDEAAALTSALDLVISAPTAVSFLSAALGVTTWQMTCGADWQAHGTDRNLWFPVMKQYKRAWNERWAPVIETIAADLQALARNGGKAPAPDLAPPASIPGSAEAHAALGELCWRKGDRDEAAEHLLKAIALDPARSSALALLGAIRFEQGRHDEALRYQEAASGIEPGQAQQHYNVAIVLQAMHRTPDAIARFERAGALDPRLFEAYFHAGNGLLKEGEPARAVARYRRVIAEKADHADAHSNLASAYGALGELEQALESAERALALDPDHAGALSNMGIVLHYQGRLREAIDCYERALSLAPELAMAELNLGIARLMTGDFERGWQAYESHFRANDSEDRLLAGRLPYPTWRGESLAGKSILVWGEQGVGDQMQLSGMLPEIAREARRCVIECSGKLVPLFARSFPAAVIVPMTNPPHPDIARGFDYQVSLGGIPRWRRRHLGDFPRARGHLVPEPERVRYWGRRLSEIGAGPKIGFSWRSCNVKGDRALACTQLVQWGPIFALPGVHFVSLQYDECSAELAAARSRFGVALHVFPEVDLFNDMDEAAALTRACDLVISAPTAVSVLAAAVGVETWQKSYGPDWQTHGTPGNPWLPAMVRYERRWNQSWDESISIVAQSLAEWLKSGTARR